MNSDTSNSQRQVIAEFDVREALDTLASQKLLVSVIFVGILFAGFLYAILASPVYEADVLVQVEEKKGSELAGLQQIAQALAVSQSPTVGEIELMKSREVIGKAIDALHLSVQVAVNHRVTIFADGFERSVGGKGIRLAEPKLDLATWAWGGELASVPVFDVGVESLGASFKLVAHSAQAWQLLDGKGTVLADGKVGEQTAFLAGGRPGSILVDKLVARPGESFTIKRLSQNATYSNLLHALTISETAKQSSVIRASIKDGNQILAVQIVDEIAKAYLAQNVARRSEEAEHSLLFLEQQLPKVQKDVEKAEVAFNAYRLSKQSVDLDKEAESLLSRSVDLEKSRLEGELNAQLLKQRFQSNHPDVVTAENQLSTIQAEENKVTAQIKQLPETQQEFLRLDRDVKVNTDLYISLLNNAEQLRISKAGTVGNVRVIDYAVPADQPSSPHRGQVMLIALLVALAGSVSSAFTARALRPTLRHAAEIERQSGVPVYATVPSSAVQGKLLKQNKADIKLLHKNNSADPAIEALRGLRMGLQFALVGAINNVILVAGPLPGIGKTFVAANLAAVLGAGGKRVLLIDGDLRKPRLHFYYGLPMLPGLSNYLLGEVSVENLVHRYASENVSVITAGVRPPNPAELLNLPQLQDLFVKLSKEYDYVIVDSPPLLVVSDALTLGRLAGAIFTVLRAEVSSMQHFQDMSRRMDTAGLKMKGIIFNGLKPRSLGYGDSYSYAYRDYL